MIITVSLPRVVAAISQLEGRQIDEVEMQERPQRYAGKLREHLSTAYGLLLNGYQDRGNVCDYGCTLQTQDRDKIIAGLTLLQALSVSIQSTDLAALVLQPVTLAAMKDNWSAIEGDLTRIGVEELWDKLESAAQKIVFAKPEEPMSVEAAVNFDQWCLEHGLRVPATKTPRQIRAEEEAKARREAAEARHAEHESSWHVREFPTGD